MKKNILLVEYAADTIEAVKEALSHPNLEITLAEEGEAAKLLLKKNKFDLMITAAMLPKFHGFSLSLYVAKNYPGTRIIVISGIYKGEDTRHKAINQYKADEFLEKPLDKNQLRDRVFELLSITQTKPGDDQGAATVQVPRVDTASIPVMKKAGGDGKQLSSEDIFGDIITTVESTSKSRQKTGAKVSPGIKPAPGKTGDTGEAGNAGDAAQKPAPLESGSPTTNIPATFKTVQIQNGEALVTETFKTVQIQTGEVQLEETFKTIQIQPGTVKFDAPTPAPQTTKIRIAPQTAKEQGQDSIPPKKAPGSLDTQKFEYDMNDLRKPKPGEKEKDDQKYQKIEDEINKKLEDTVSGLGIKGKKANESLVTQRIDIPPESLLKEQKPADAMTTQRIDVNPALELKAHEEKLTRVREQRNETFATRRITATDFEKLQKKEDVGDYEILDLIARGGMAEIYRAKKKGVKGFEKIIALKKILAGYVEDDKYIEMFVDEAKIAAQLTHPNIVQIYDLGQKDDFYFIAMEYVWGKDLRVILRRLAELKRPFPESLALYLMMQTLAALNYAHSARDSSGNPLQIVHRDISPPNILVSYSGDIKLTDFGVSKATTKRHETVSGALKGKLLYMSPEQAKAEIDIDNRSDIYSAGIILFELITGKKLFMDSTDLLVLKKVQEGEIIRPRQIKPGVHPDLENIILKALNKNKERRYGNAGEMRRDIEAYLTGHYDRLPGPIHISHFLAEIFKAEILSKKIELDLKPLPYKIKKLSGEAEFPEEIEEPLNQQEDWGTINIKEHMSSFNAETIPIQLEEEEEESGFKPIVEIDLDTERPIDSQPAKTPGATVKTQIREEQAEDNITHVMKELEEVEKKNRKKLLIWGLIAILTFTAIVVILLNIL